MLYIGMADRLTVRQRFNGADKRKGLFRDLWAERSIAHDNLKVTVGVLSFLPGQRYSSKLLLDAEGLLIIEILPWGNIRHTKTRPVTRPGMRVRCSGVDWPHTRRHFTDTGALPPLPSPSGSSEV